MCSHRITNNIIGFEPDFRYLADMSSQIDSDRKRKSTATYTPQRSIRRKTTEAIELVSGSLC